MHFLSFRLFSYNGGEAFCLNRDCGKKMLYLLSAIFCSALVSLTLKVGERYPYSTFAMLGVNYMTCTLSFLITRIGKSLPSSGLGFCTVLAAVNGFLYLGCMVMNTINVKRSGAILQSTFVRLGVMVPTLLSIVLFGERPSVRQAVAIVLVLAAFCIMNISDGDDASHTKTDFLFLFLGLFFGGASDSMSKVFEEYGERGLDDAFIGLTFFFAFLMCMVLVFARHERVRKRELLLGTVLGVPNYISSLLLLKALSFVSAYIAYPTYSVGVILTVTAVSVLFFRERLSKWKSAGVCVIIIAIVLLNI